MAAPPLMHRKGHAGSGDHQRHQDDHGFGRYRFSCAPSASRGHADERAFHLLLNALHRTSTDAALARDLAYAFAATQMRLDALFKRGIVRGLPSCVPCATARLRPAWMRCRIMLRSNSANAPQT